MTRRESNARARGLTVALVATIAGAFLLAALPAHAQRASVNSLAVDHDEILAEQHHGVVPISACGTIAAPGSYVVTQNLNAVGTCLVVTADHVTIDLNGFRLGGSGSGGGLDTDATFANPRFAIAVRNGTVTGFGVGVDFSFVTGAVVEGVRAVDNISTGIRTGRGSTVTGNTAIENDIRGIRAVAGSTVTGNTARGNGQIGIVVACPSNVIGNTATDNPTNNLQLEGAGCNVAHNVAP